MPGCLFKKNKTEKKANIPSVERLIKAHRLSNNFVSAYFKVILFNE